MRRCRMPQRPVPDGPPVRERKPRFSPFPPRIMGKKHLYICFSLRATLSIASDQMRHPSGWPLGGVAGPWPSLGPATTGAFSDTKRMSVCSSVVDRLSSEPSDQHE